MPSIKNPGNLQIEGYLRQANTRLNEMLTEEYTQGNISRIIYYTARLAQIYKDYASYGMSMMKENPIEHEVTLHNHDIPYPIPLTPYITSVNLTKGNINPFENAQINIKIPSDVAFNLFNNSKGFPETGHYIMVKKPLDGYDERKHFSPYQTKFIGVVKGYKFSTMTDQSSGNVMMSEITIDCESFLYPLMTGQYKVTLHNVILNNGETGALSGEPNIDAIKQAVDEAESEDAALLQASLMPGTQEFMFGGRRWGSFFVQEIEGAFIQKDVRDEIQNLIKLFGYMRLPRSFALEPTQTRAIFEKIRDSYSKSLIGFDRTTDERVILERFLQNVTQITDRLMDDFDSDDTAGARFEIGAGSGPGQDVLGSGFMGTDITNPVLYTKKLQNGQLRIGDFLHVATSKKDVPYSSDYYNQLPTHRMKAAQLPRIQNAFQRGGSVWDLVTGTFQTDPNLIECFFTFIPFTRSDVDNYHNEWKVPNPLCYALGGVPTIVYRYTPMHPNLLLEQDSLNQQYSREEDLINQGLGAIPHSVDYQLYKGKEYAEDQSLSHDGIPEDSVLQNTLDNFFGDYANKISAVNKYTFTEAKDKTVVSEPSSTIDDAPAFDVDGQSVFPDREVSDYPRGVSPTGPFGRMYPMTSMTSPNYNKKFFGVPIFQDSIIGLQMEVDDAKRINATYVESPYFDDHKSLAVNSVLSAPVINSVDAVKHGLRMVEVDSPFKDLNVIHNAKMSEMLYGAFGGGNNYYSGQIILNDYWADIYPGQWHTIIYETLENYMKASAVSEIQKLVIYVDMVKETKTVDPQTGVVTKSLLINFNRGSFSGRIPTFPRQKQGLVTKI